MMRTIVSYALALFFFFGFFSPNGRAQQTVTNDQLYQVIGDAHNVMARQRKQLRNALEGFLTGDWDRIDQASNRMLKDMDAVASRYAPPYDVKVVVWDAMQTMRHRTKNLRDFAEKKDFGSAIVEFNGVVRQCIECHEVKRVWGRFKGGSAPSEAPLASQSLEPVEEILAKTDSTELPEAAIVEY
jgi:hypothetical protein